MVFAYEHVAFARKYPGATEFWIAFGNRFSQVFAYAVVSAFDAVKIFTSVQSDV